MVLMSKEPFRPRGKEVMLPHGGLPEVLPKYLLDLIANTGGAEGPIGLQFIAQPDREKELYDGDPSDPLIEDEHEVSPGLIYKYQAKYDDEGKMIAAGRALWTITFQCAAYCRFCTRGREVGVPEGHVRFEGDEPHVAHLSKAQIDETLQFIEQNDGIREIILSGGDPLTIRPDVLKYVLGNLGKMQREGKLGVVRIGTRLPIHNPYGIKEAHYDAIKELKNPRMMIHANHVSELTPEVIRVLNRFRSEALANIHIQSVFLKGVNDSVGAMYDLFDKSVVEGYNPYYVYYPDRTYWDQHLKNSFEEMLAVSSEFRRIHSGLESMAKFVIDTPGGHGKIPLPEGNAWTVDYEAGFLDYEGKRFYLDQI